MTTPQTPCHGAAQQSMGRREMPSVLDSGDGPVRFAVNRAAHPCRWMDVTVGEGAWKALRGRGGVRTTPLDDGVLRVGPVTVAVE